MILTPTKSWMVYHILLLFRVAVAPFLTGYIHPDEFFQGGQELWFGCPPSRTWEFQSENAVRSVVPPTIMTWLPLQLVAKIRGVDMEHLSGWYIWIIPRVACAIFSIIAVDGSIWVLSSDKDSKTVNKWKEGVPIPVLMVASAWPTMALLNRPFSNAMETWTLALLFRTVVFDARDEKRRQPTLTLTQCVTIGVLSSLGIFTRFTFIFFAFPIIVYLGFRMLYELRGFDRLFKAGVTCLGFLCASGIMMELDREFYQSNDLVLTPWNLLSYNVSVENLKKHGIHPRWTHALVNMFMLYGPMTLLAYLSTLSALWWSDKTKKSEGQDTSSKSKTIGVLSRCVILFGLGILSAAPHQEPRFLLPLLVPISLLSDHHWIRGRHGIWLIYLWVGFNAALLFVFGVLHQSGVVPSLLAFGSVPSLLERSPTAVVFYHMYMPPTFLSRTDTGCRDIELIDLDGSHNVASLRETLSKNIPCNNEDGGNSYVHLVSSPFSDGIGDDPLYLGDGRCSIPGYACASIWNFGAHLSLEDPPPLTDLRKGRFPLSIYEISCKSM